MEQSELTDEQVQNQTCCRAQEIIKLKNAIKVLSIKVKSSRDHQLNRKIRKRYPLNLIKVMGAEARAEKRSDKSKPTRKIYQQSQTL